MAEGLLSFFTDLNTGGFESGAKRLQAVGDATSSKIQGAFSGVAGTITKLVAPLLTVYTAINSVKDALDMGGRLNDLSKATGESAGNLALLERAFQNTGVGAEKVGPMFAKMSSFVSDLAEGTPKAAQTAESLGITLDQLKGKTPTEQFEVLLKAVAGLSDENLRAAAAGDVFGDKMGYKLVPFAKDFNQEMANAKGELGSTVRLLNENAGSLDDVGDKFGAIRGKLTEFTIGLASGTSGANSLVDALSKIDAAGLGERVGNALKAAFAAPLEVLQSYGDFLLSGIAKAGNALVAAFRYAVDVFYTLLTSSDFWSGLADRVSGGLAKIGQGVALVIVDGIQSALKTLQNVPFLGDFAKQAASALDEVRKQIVSAGETANMALQEGSEKISDAWDKASSSAKYVYQDIFGAAKLTESSQKHLEAAYEAAKGINNESKTTAENFKSGSHALSKALGDLRGFNLGGEPEPKKPWLDSTNNSRGPLAQPGDAAMPSPQGGGARNTGSAGSSAQARDKTFNELVAEARGAGLAQSALDRAAYYQRTGAYTSAVREELRAAAIMEREMEKARVKDILGGKDLGRAYEDYRDKTSIRDRLSREEFEAEIKAAAKEIEKDPLPKKPKDKSSDEPVNQKGVNERTKLSESVLDKIYTVLDQRLPIKALA